MGNEPPPQASVRAGHELRDVRPSLVVAAAAVLVFLGASLLILLWEVSRYVAPAQAAPGGAPPVVMPGEPPVNDRVRAIPPPRLDPLEPLAVESPARRPEDLRADRQPALNGYGWVEKGKVARIPIGRAMDVVVEAERAKSVAKKGGGK